MRAEVRQPDSRRAAAGAAGAGRRGAAAIATAVTALVVFAPKLPFTTPYSPRFAALVTSAVVWAWAWALGSADGDARRRRLYWAVFAVAGVTVLSAATSATPFTLLTYGAEGGLTGAPSWIAMLVVFALASRARVGRDVRDALTLALAWGSAVALAGIALAVSGRNVSAGFGNGNYFGSAMVLLAPIALVAAAEAGSKGWATAYRVAAVLTLLGAALSGSTAVAGAVLLEVLALALFAPSLLGSRLAERRRLVVALVCGALVLVALAGAVYLADGPLPPRVRAAVADAASGRTTQTRVEMWEAALGVWRERPLLGVGPDGFQMASQGHLTRRLMELEGGATYGHRALIRDAHSLPMTVLAGLGLAGLAALVWLAVEWALALRDRLRGSPSAVRGRGRASGDERASSAEWRLGLAIGVGGFLLCMLLVPWHVLFAGLPALVAGLAVAPDPGEESGGHSKGEGPVLRPRAARLVLSSAAILVAVWLAYAAVASDAWMLRALRSGSAAEAEVLWRRATAAQPFRPYVRAELLYSLGRLTGEGAVPLGVFHREVDAAPPEITRNGAYLAEMVQVGLDDAQLSGRVDVTWERAKLAEAARLAPNHPDVVLENAHLALASGDLAGARRYLDVAGTYAGVLERGDRYLLYRYLAAEIAGDDEDAASYAAQVRENAPWLEYLMTPSSQGPG